MFIFYLTRHMKLAKDKVSFSMRLAAYQARGGADTRHLKPSVFDNMLLEK
jgi:hypothetical protein